jgi:neuronal cell adhesion molecule
LPSSYYIEQTTGSAAGGAIPDRPYFNIDTQPSENGFGKAKVTWIPNFSGTPGSHFYVQYREKGAPSFTVMDAPINEDNVEISGLEPNQEYEFRVVSVDGQHETPSAIKGFDTNDSGRFNEIS